MTAAAAAVAAPVIWNAVPLDLGLFHTDASTRSKYLPRVTCPYLNHCVFTLTQTQVLVVTHSENIRLNYEQLLWFTYLLITDKNIYAHNNY